jgi:hypothetical protein
MSRGTKLLILFALMGGSAVAFENSQKTGHPGMATFFSFFTVGTLIALIATALKRRS